MINLFVLFYFIFYLFFIRLLQEFFVIICVIGVVGCIPVFQTGGARSNRVWRSGSNLVVIKTQGVLKGYTGDHYSSYRVEDSI